jgi:hypothetical protein
LIETTADKRGSELSDEQFEIPISSEILKAARKEMKETSRLEATIPGVWNLDATCGIGSDELNAAAVTTDTSIDV